MYGAGISLVVSNHAITLFVKLTLKTWGWTEVMHKFCVLIFWEWKEMNTEDVLMYAYHKPFLLVLIVLAGFPTARGHVDFTWYVIDKLLYDH